MGGVQATLTTQTLNDYTQYMNSIVNNVYQSNKAGCDANNNLQVTPGIIVDENGNQKECYFQFIDGNITINQKVNANCSFSSDNTSTITNTVQNQIQNSTKQFIDNDLQNKQGWFATAFSFQITGATNSTDVSNIISNSITNNVQQECSAIFQSAENGYLPLCGVYKDANIVYTQDGTVTGIVSCINKSVIANFISNSTLNQLYQATNNKLLSKQSGIGSVFKYIFYIIGAIIGCILLIIIIKVIFKAIGNKNKGEDNRGEDKKGEDKKGEDKKGK